MGKLPTTGIRASGAIDAALGRLEQRFDAVSSAIVSGDCAALESASSGLRALALECSSLIESSRVADAAPAPVAARLRRLAQGMVFQRENLARRLACVERTLHALVPGTRQATYGAGAGPYGSSARRSGAFSSLAA